MKLFSREEIVSKLTKSRNQKARVGFTSGVFDILHAGHVEYLAKARELCDILVVGVNSDSSVTGNKGPGRPINTAVDRAFVLAGLSTVDFVFIFEESNNRKNIELLKPDFYFKAGDYTKDQLTSASLVESYGGKVCIIPARGGYSTTRTIERIRSSDPREIEIRSKPPSPVVFVDRDGVINEEVEYLHQPEQFRLIPGVLDALGVFKKSGVRIAIVTNQAGIGLGYFTKEDFFRVNKVLLTEASKAGIIIDRIYYCPHGAGDDCRCRKPKPGMIERGIRELNADLKRSFLIGDKASDIEAGKAAGVRTVLVKTGHGAVEQVQGETPWLVVKDLKEASLKIIEELGLA